MEEGGSPTETLLRLLLLLLRNDFSNAFPMAYQSYLANPRVSASSLGKQHEAIVESHAFSEKVFACFFIRFFDTTSVKTQEEQRILEEPRTSGFHTMFCVISTWFFDASSAKTQDDQRIPEEPRNNGFSCNVCVISWVFPDVVARA